jgi:hypothetical protein
MIDVISPLVKGASKELTDKRKQIFDEPVHITMDNFFSGDDVLKFLGLAGVIAFQEMYQNHISTSSRHPLSTSDQKLQDLSNPSLLLRMSSSQKRYLQKRTPRFKGQQL